MKLDDLQRVLDKLEPRERRLAGAFAAFLVLAVLLAVPFGIDSVVGARRDGNRAIRDAIAAIKAGRDRVRACQAKKEAVASRYANRAPPLAGFIEKAAKDNHLELPESQDRPEVPHGKRYVERTTVVRFRKAGMLALARTLESLETQRMPVAVTRLNVRKRGGERDSYDVELGVSAFDRSEGPSSPSPASSAAPGGAR